jgi:hypothetical protein
MLSVVTKEKTRRAGPRVEQQKQSGTQTVPQGSAAPACDEEVMRLPVENSEGSHEACARSATIMTSNRVAALLMSIRQMSLGSVREAERIEVSRQQY